MNGNNITETTESLSSDIKGPVECPICSSPYGTLTELNSHLDKDHSLGGSMSTPRTSSGRRYLVKSPLRRNSIKSPGSKTLVESPPKNKETQSKPRIKNTHWQKFPFESQNCRKCSIKLKDHNSGLNCRKCGRLFCKKHCINKVKLDLNAKYDSINGKWYICCERCYNLRPGFNDYGTFKDLSKTFFKVRISKNEDKTLIGLQLANRLVRLIDGSINLYKQYNGNMLMRLKFNNELSKLEKNVCPWKDDKGVIDCEICKEPFTLTIRKHHCRICGSVVCDYPTTRCSRKIPFQLLLNASRDLPFKNTTNFKEIHEMQYDILVCKKCTTRLYSRKMFDQSLNGPHPPLFQLHSRMNAIEHSIKSMIPNFEKLALLMEKSKDSNEKQSNEILQEASGIRNKIMRNFTSYNTIVQQLGDYKPRNNSEQKIKASLQSVATNFINRNILPLKSMTLLLTSNETENNNNEIETGDNVKKLSDLLYNNLTIKQIKDYRDELMVLKEQHFLVQTMLDEAKSQRRFEEMKSLEENLSELNNRIKEIEENLGDQGFQ